MYYPGTMGGIPYVLPWYIPPYVLPWYVPSLCTPWYIHHYTTLGIPYHPAVHCPAC